ncbi:helix-turn-helix domain-containing protein [Asticcacaulis sp. YBE204]|uniref:helix-turn-helix domain-containing protein n=1 Tax=Asticcacaulis sp. YBE204 TaxID=1282363 RepID=UPI000417D1A5|nr:helix-turn-helix transcriptional regulator [Asticcacaulis sp. YBE204]
MLEGEKHPVDVHVGQIVRLNRKRLGITQETLADAIGLTFQQVQKYESGANRISSSKLFEISRFLGIPVARFFDGIDPVAAPASDGVDGKVAGPDFGLESGMSVARFLASAEGAELARYFVRINATKRRSVLALVKAMSHDEPKYTDGK